MELLVAVVVLLVLGLNAYASVLVGRSHFYGRRQKIAQLFLIRFVPVIGACLCWSVAKVTEPPKVTTDFAEYAKTRQDGHTRVQTGGFEHGGGGGADAGGD